MATMFTDFLLQGGVALAPPSACLPRCQVVIKGRLVKPVPWAPGVEDTPSLSLPLGLAATLSPELEALNWEEPQTVELPVFDGGGGLEPEGKSKKVEDEA